MVGAYTVHAGVAEGCAAAAATPAGLGLFEADRKGLGLVEQGVCCVGGCSDVLVGLRIRKDLGWEVLSHCERGLA